MQEDTTPQPPEEPTYQDLWDSTVKALTQATRQGRDIGDFLASALAATAANVGSGERVLNGRPGSWEADLVRGLIFGTVGHDEEYLTECRTEPVEITVNVSRLISERTGTYPVDDELAGIDKRYSAMDSDVGDDEYDAQVDEQAAEEDAANLKWTTRFQDYGVRFKASVEAEVAKSGMRIPVTVTINADLDWYAHGGGNAELHTDLDYEEGDRLVGRLFEAGVAVVLSAYEQDVKQ